MFRARRQVSEGMLAQGLDLIFIVQQACAFDCKIELFLAVVGYGLAIAVCIQSDFAEASYGLKGSIVLVTFSEHRLVVTGWRSEISLRLREVGNEAMQPGGIDGPVLGAEPLYQQQREEQDFDGPSGFNPGH